MTDTLSAVLRERDSKREGLVQRDRDSENPAGRTNEMPSPEGVTYEHKLHDIANTSQHINYLSCTVIQKTHNFRNILIINPEVQHHLAI